MCLKRRMILELEELCERQERMEAIVSLMATHIEEANKTMHNIKHDQWRQTTNLRRISRYLQGDLPPSARRDEE